MGVSVGLVTLSDGTFFVLRPLEEIDLRLCLRRLAAGVLMQLGWWQLGLLVALKLLKSALGVCFVRNLLLGCRLVGVGLAHFFD